MDCCMDRVYAHGVPRRFKMFESIHETKGPAWGKAEQKTIADEPIVRCARSSFCRQEPELLDLTACVCILLIHLAPDLASHEAHASSSQGCSDDKSLLNVGPLVHEIG